jgi:hypothetical protein
MQNEKARKVAVNLTALVQRINHALAKDGKVMKKARGPSELGRYVLDTNRNVVIDHAMTPQRIERLARDLGVLADFEEVRWDF